MKKTVVILLLLLLSFKKGEAQEIFEKLYGSQQSISGKIVLQNDDNGFIIGGSVRDSLNISNDYLLIKTDSIGNIIWSKTYGGIRNEFLNKIVQTKDNGFILLGTTYSYGIYGIGIINDTIRANMYIVKIDSTGNVVWSYTYGNILEDSGFDLIEKRNGNLVITGITNSYFLNSSQGDIFILTISKDGIELSNKIIYSPNQWYEDGQNIVESLDGGYFISGSVSDAVNFGDSFIMKIDSLSNLQWLHRTGDSASATFNTEMLPNNNGGFVFAFSTYGFSIPQYSDFIIADYDSSGTVLWSKKYGNVAGGDDQITAFSKLDDSTGYLFASFSRVSKIDNYGNVIWSCNSSSSFNNIVLSACSNKNNSASFCGYTMPSKLSFIQMDSLGNNCDALQYIYPNDQINLQMLNFNFNDSINAFYIDSGCVQTNIILSDTSYCLTHTFIDYEVVNEKTTVSPNPFTDYITIDISQKIKHPLVSITDQYGRIVYCSFLNDEKLYLNNLKTGLYILSIETSTKFYKYKILKL